MSQQGLAAFRALVHADPALARYLRRLPEASFPGAVVRAAAWCGCDVTHADVAEARRTGTSDWRLRWTQ